MGIINSLSSKFKAAKHYLGNLAKAREDSKAEPIVPAAEQAVLSVLTKAGDPAVALAAASPVPAKKAKKAKPQRPLPRALRNARSANRGVPFDNHSLRNRPCSCGSGRKFKKCCLSKMRIGAYQAYLAAVARAEKAKKRAA
jgi:uncharacterized protein YecA (UPF0149 family)